MNVNRKTKPKRLLSMLLVLMMVLTLLPTTAFAEDGTVTGLALNQSTGQITWGAYPDATSYDVWVTPESGSGTPLSYDVTGTSFDLKQGLVDKNFADGTYYPYVIACKNGAKIAYSGQKTTAGYAFTNTVPELAVPGNINWNGTNASWDAVTNASKYEYKIKPADNSSGYIFSGETTDGTTTSVTAKATPYIAGKAYILQVRAIGDGTSYRTGKFGSSAEVTPNTGSPTVTGLTLNQSTGQITWDAYPDATSYDVWVDPESGSGTPLSYDVTGTSFDLKQGLRDKNIADGTYYPYVLANNGNARIASTGQKTTDGYAFTNTVPELAVPGNINWNGTNASWDAVPKASKYEYKIKPADNSSGSIFSDETTDGTTTSVTAKATSYIAGKAYILQVRAIGDGTSYRTGKFGSSAEVIPSTVTPTTYTVTVSKPSNVTKTASSGDETQIVNAGDAITEIVYTANYGYYFSSSYGVYNKGISIDKISNTQIKVWGTPKGDVTVPVGGPTEKANQAAPTGVAGGELKIMGTGATMEYAAVGSDAWKDCTATETTVAFAGDYKVRLKETDTKKAGAETTVTVTAGGGTTTTYTVTFDANGQGTAPAALTDVASGATISAPTAPTASGYTFEGWYKEAACTNAWNFGTDTVTSNITLYAKWTAVTPTTTYTVTFDANGGNCGTTTATTGTDGKLTSLPTATRSGSYSFKGWYTAASGGTKITTDDVFSADTTVYAQWTYTGGSGGGTPVVGPSTPSGGSESGAGAGTGTSTEIKPDGTEVITEKKPDGTETVTEKKTDGSEKITEKTPDGTETVTEKKTDGSEKITEKTPDGIETVTEKKTDGSEKVTEKQPDGTKVVTDIASDGKATAEVTLPSGKDKAEVEVPAPLGSKDGTVTAKVTDKKTGEVKEVKASYSDGKVSVSVAGDSTIEIMDDFVPLASAAIVFSDVADSHWAKDAIDKVVAKGLFKGITETQFSPNANMTREQMWMVLSRLAGNNFAAMQEAADWAKSKGITDGSNPKDPVTREQFVTLMWRTLGSPASSYDLSKYTDSSSVSDWAKEAMAWAVETGLVSGTSATELSPAATATRAQIATIFARYLDK